MMINKTGRTVFIKAIYGWHVGSAMFGYPVREYRVKPGQSFKECIPNRLTEFRESARLKVAIWMRYSGDMPEEYVDTILLTTDFSDPHHLQLGTIPVIYQDDSRLEAHTAQWIERVLSR